MIIANPFTLILHFLGLGLDIIMLFLIIRLLLNWKPIPWLEGFNQTGKPIVDYFINLIGEYFYQKKQTMLTSNSKLWLSLSLVSLGRFLLAGLMHLCS